MLKNALGNTQITMGDHTNDQSNIVLNDSNGIPTTLLGFKSNGTPIFAITNGTNVFTALGENNNGN
jgi:hypothetical protein